MGHRVTILGGGFGGLYAARQLSGRKDIDVTLIDRRNFHLFQPLLYQVATGELSPADVAFPLRVVFSRDMNVRVIMGEAVDLDPNEKKVILSDGSSELWDTLIVSTGARNFYFGNDSWQEFAPGLKSIEDATRIRHRILYAFEAAERASDPEERAAWLTFVVVGAGPTGVELAGALGEIANDTLRGDFRYVNTREARILLVDNSSRVLATYSPDSSEHAEKALIALGTRSIFHTKVTAIDAKGVTVQTPAGEQRIAAHTVLWAAGVAASEFGGALAKKTGIQLQKGGRVLVDEYCNIAGHPEIFVIGDLAMQNGADGKPLPGVAPVAMQQGRYVAKLTVARLRGKSAKPFQYIDKGMLAVIGRASAIAEIRKFHLHGLLAWLTWLFVHLAYLAGFQNRLVVFIRWAFNYFTFNRGARLITGDPAPYEATRSVPDPSPKDQAENPQGVAAGSK